MKVIRSLILLTIITIVVYCCNQTNITSPSSSLPRKHIVGRDDDRPCCNNVDPYQDDCGGTGNPNHTFGFWCNGIDYDITCTCCMELWDHYPHPNGTLQYTGPPCPGDLDFICNNGWRQEP